MAITLLNIQERVGRNIYETIRRCMVDTGYLPDITNTSLFPMSSEGFGTTEADVNWKAALRNIEISKSFATELFGEGSAQSKGLKKVPRIVIQSNRILPGNLGVAGILGYQKNPQDPDKVIQVLSDWQSANLHYDILVVCNTTKQERVLNSIINASLGIKKYLPLLDSNPNEPQEYMFCRLFNYFDLEGENEGIIEKVYSYEITDMFLYQEVQLNPISLIQNMEIFTDSTNLVKYTDGNGNIVTGYEVDGKIVFDLNVVKFE